MTEYDKRLKSFLIEELQKLKVSFGNNPKSKIIGRAVNSLLLYPGPMTEENACSLSGVGEYLSGIMKQLINRFKSDPVNIINESNKDSIELDEVDFKQYLNYKEPLDLDEWARANQLNRDLIHAMGWTSILEVSKYLLTEDDIIKHSPTTSFYEKKKLTEAAEKYYNFKNFIQNNEGFISLKQIEEERIRKEENKLLEKFEDIEIISYSLFPKITDTMIRTKCGEEKKYQTAFNYFKNKNIERITVGDYKINAICASESSTDTKYTISIPFINRKIKDGDCQCRGDLKGAWCKHKLSVLIAINRYLDENKDLDFIDVDFINTYNSSSSNPTSPRTVSRQSKPKSPTYPTNNNNNNKYNQEYIPEFRSQSWAILMVLYNNFVDNVIYLTKEQIMVLGATHCDTKFGKDWYNKKLLNEKLISKEGKPAKYSITTKGRILFSKLLKKLNENNNNSDNNNNLEDNNDDNSFFNKPLKIPKYIHDSDVNTTMQLDAESMEIDESLKDYYTWSDSDEELTDYMINNSIIPLDQVKDYIYNEKEIVIEEVYLIIDNREIKTSAQSNSNYTKILESLKTSKVKYELKSLPVGDFIWVARAYKKLDPTKTIFEIMLNIIIERKTLSDLKSSTYDGRYESQKFKLKHTKIPNIIYLIEGDNYNCGVIPLDEFSGLCVDIQVKDSFTLKITDSDRDTLIYLTSLDQAFHKDPFRYLSHLRLDDLYKIMDRLDNPVLSDLMALQLLQYSRMNDVKAKSIISEYTTPYHLFNGYKDARNSLAKEILLETASYDENKKNEVGENVSKEMNILWNSKEYED